MKQTGAELDGSAPVFIFGDNAKRKRKSEKLTLLTI